jgi:hypothetical protein
VSSANRIASAVVTGLASASRGVYPTGGTLPVSRLPDQFPGRIIELDAEPAVRLSQIEGRLGHRLLF